MGMKKVKTFLNDHLRNRTTAINASIKKIITKLPGNITEKLKLQENKVPHCYIKKQYVSEKIKLLN